MIPATGGHAGHGPHIPKAAADAQQIEWTPPQRREERHRTKQWTCQAHDTVYYLIDGGGHAWIARVAKDTSHETHRMSHDEAQDLWNRLLRGLAR